MGRKVVLLAIALWPVGLACVDLGGLAGSSDGADASGDAAMTDAPTGSDPEGGPDAGLDSSKADAAAVYSYNDVTDATFWKAYDLAPINTGAKGFSGGVFDGRYVYFTPNDFGNGNVAARYDTQGTFNAAGSWSMFNLSVLNDASARGYYGAAFDGRYIYFAPYRNTSTFHGKVLRYDTKGVFGAASSWTIFDTSAVDANAQGFAGAVFDGRYVYFIPQYSVPGGGYDGLMLRYDTTASFTDIPAAWTKFDTKSLSATASGFQGGVFDGRYLYLVPYSAGMDAVTVRYDTKGGFASGSSWFLFDLRSINANSGGFFGGAFDGRHVYFVPSPGSGPPGNGLLSVFDTMGDFTQVTAWTTLDLTFTAAGNAKGFRNAGFDGRYMYFVPNSASLLARYDTTASVSAGASWATFELKGVSSSVYGYNGAIFDGRYMYLVPFATSVVMRFDARSPTGAPPFGGSFF